MIVFIYPRCRSACLGLCTLCICPFRAFIVCCCLYLSKVPLCLIWAMYALHLPFQGVYCLLLSLFTQGAALLDLGYVRFAFALSGRLLFVTIIIYPRCRFACLGLCTLCVCPFRAFIVCYYRYLPKVPLRLPWAMYALRLPFQGVCCYR